jgi:hypothetical protein
MLMILPPYEAANEFRNHVKISKDHFLAWLSLISGSQDLRIAVKLKKDSRYVIKRLTHRWS